jgi:hypothetical protein
MGIQVARSTDECLNALVEIDDALGAPQPGRLKRVMRTLGLQKPISV